MRTTEHHNLSSIGSALGSSTPENIHDLMISYSVEVFFNVYNGHLSQGLSMVINSKS